MQENKKEENVEELNIDDSNVEELNYGSSEDEILDYDDESNINNDGNYPEQQPQVYDSNNSSLFNNFTSNNSKLFPSLKDLKQGTNVKMNDRFGSGKLDDKKGSDLNNKNVSKNDNKNNVNSNNSNLNNKNKGNDKDKKNKENKNRNNNLNNKKKNFTDKIKFKKRNNKLSKSSKSDDITSKKSSMGNRISNKIKSTTNKVKKTASKQSKKIAMKAGKALIAFLKSPVGIISLIVIAVILLLVILISVFSSRMPLIGGEVGDTSNYNGYSKADQKTIDNVNSIAQRYPNGDPSLAMVATIYAYTEEIQDGNVYALRKNKGQSAEANTEESEEYRELLDGDITQDDPYLELFRDTDFLDKFEELLEKTQDGEEEFKRYLKEDYFEDDEGYKLMFDGLEENTDDADEEELKNELADAIIDDLYDSKSDFEGYFFDICSTSYNLQSLGQTTLTDDDIMNIIRGNVSIDVHVGEAGCTTGNTECGESGVYPFDRYVQGVVYEEIADVTDIEKIKAQMVAVKVFTLNRATIFGDEENGYDLYIIWGQAAQDFCDIYDGCEDAAHGDSDLGHGTNRAPASTEMQRLYQQSWEETKGVYIIEDEGIEDEGIEDEGEGQSSSKLASVHYMNGCPSNWVCLEQANLLDNTYDGEIYQDILSAEFEMDSNGLDWFIGDGGYFSSYGVTASEDCSNVSSGNSCGIDTSNFKFYYQTDYPDVAFCGLNSVSGCRNDGGQNTICTSGCGVTAYAMLVANLSDDTSFSPIEANNEATATSTCDSEGSRGTLFTSTLVNYHEGFTATRLTYDNTGVEKALDTIRAGGMVVANVQENSPFTDGGHWIIIRAIDEDGKVLVADPNSSDRSTNESYDLSDLVEQKWLTEDDGTIHEWYAIMGPKSSENVCSVTSNNGIFDIIDSSPYGKNISVGNMNDIYGEYNSRAQCVGYVKGRGAEILSTANLSKLGITTEEANRLAKIVNKTAAGGAAINYCDSGLKNYFNISTDYTKPKAGSLVVWGGGEFGHVAVVEDVNGSKVTISEGNWTDDSNLSSLITGSGKWERGVADLSYIKNRGNHGFKCYIYLLDPK